ncbi:dihydroneopterin aldolase [Parahaliea maris]|uniref:7,8-dihydroneopterin aldolase n=1 Tax=Parahaliea maris TaxID=2716870 RepID=A0A5C8ZTN9_9GAMM|nr:dihydroneopterin aldolase [Parahaliea maris]TXS90827.1 dihydroneopterin aldolase [Parahaliea maris]
MDTVFIRELAVDTVIGVYDWEREVRQTLLLDLDMAWDNRPAAAGDDLSHALNYAAVADRIVAFLGGSEFLLIETAAEEIAALVRSEFGVPWLRLRLCKPGAVAAARDVGVVIERGERSA